MTHDVASYLHREWPLAGPPMIPPDACQGSCSCCGGGAAQAPCETTYGDDWDQASMLPIARGYTDDPPPAVPLGPGPPGRFFPVPVKPPFSPQGPPTGAGF